MIPLNSTFCPSTRRLMRREAGGRHTIFLRIRASSCSSSTSKPTENRSRKDNLPSSSRTSIRLLRWPPNRCELPTSPYRSRFSCPFEKQIPADGDCRPPHYRRSTRFLEHYGAARLESAAHLDVGDLTFLPSIPEFDPLEDPPSSVRYAGPILGNELIPLPPTTNCSSSARPWILFYPGRPHDAAGPSGQTLLNIALEPLCAVAARVTVASGGYDFKIPHGAHDQFEIVPWHILSPDHKPDLIVHHGGHGACLTAITAGIASVVVPTHAEREYNARNLAALGCGEFLLSAALDARRLRGAIERVIGTADYAAACTRWSRTIAERKYGGSDLVTRMIMQVI